MAKVINFKLASFIFAASLHGASCLAPAAKAIEIDPYPNDGKCYTINNNEYINYIEGASSKEKLENNPWYGDKDISQIAAKKFYDESEDANGKKTNWRFAWKAEVSTPPSRLFKNLVFRKR